MTSITSRLGAWVLRNRRLVRAPIFLYRHRLGFLLGSRILLLEHIGRRSGQTRYVCLEVVEHPDANTFVVVSGFGERAQWYRNLRANPHCFVSVGNRTRQPARATMLDTNESASILARYQSKHPGAWRQLRGAIEQATGTRPAMLPMIRLELGRHSGAHSARASTLGSALTRVWTNAVRLPAMSSRSSSAAANDATVMAAVEQRALALAARDAGLLRQLMHPNCRWTTHAGLVLDRDSYIARNTTEVSFSSQSLVDSHAYITDKTAVVTGTVVDRLANGEEFRLLITMTWIETDTGWQLLAGHAGPRL